MRKNRGHRQPSVLPMAVLILIGLVAAFTGGPGVLAQQPGDYLVFLPLAVDGEAPAACPVSAPAQSLIEELAFEVLRDAVHVTEFAHFRGRGLALSLLGIDQYLLAMTSTLVEECTRTMVFETTCESSGGPPEEPVEPFWETRDRCSRLGCERAGVGTVEVFMTMQPHTEPDDRHAFTYETTDPEGVGRYDPNPYVLWRIDQSTAGRVVVSASLNGHVTITPTGLAAIDLRHVGTVVATKVDDEMESVDLDLALPRAAASSLWLNVDIDADRRVTGALSAGEQPIADISGEFSFDRSRLFAWRSPCRSHSGP